jgi:hypothetical protein
VGANFARWQARSSKPLNALWSVGRFDFDWFPPAKRPILPKIFH